MNVKNYVYIYRDITDNNPDWRVVMASYVCMYVHVLIVSAQ